MAHTQLSSSPRPPLKAASAMGAYLPIAFLGVTPASALTETVRLAASFNEFQFGLTLATVASAGDPVEYAIPGDIAKGIAGASMGSGAFVGVGSTNGVLGLVAAVAAGPTGPPKWAIGILLKNCAAGDLVSVFIKPDQII